MHIKWMGGEERVGSAFRVATIARPGLVAWLVDPLGADRIEIDIAAAGQAVAFRIDEG